jgi:hypothetical protein
MTLFLIWTISKTIAAAVLIVGVLFFAYKFYKCWISGKMNEE